MCGTALERLGRMMDRPRRILITGGSGFLGTHLQAALAAAGHRSVVGLDSKACDLRDLEGSKAMVSSMQPEVIFHLAARAGGIGLNQKVPGTLWRENLQMGLNVLESARAAEVRKLVLVLTCCGYPVRPKTIPFVEEEFFDGLPETTNAAYGISKRALLQGAWAYRAQYGMDIVSAIPTNLYGLHDKFEDGTSHVIPALIKKFAHAKAKGHSSVELWGTGRASRDFLNARDCAEALVKMMERYDDPEPINLGSGQEVTIAELTELLKKISGFSGWISWDTTKPDGQPRRVLNVERAKRCLDWKAETDLYAGLEEVYRWHTEQPAQVKD